MKYYQHYQLGSLKPLYPKLPWLENVRGNKDNIPEGFKIKKKKSLLKGFPSNNRVIYDSVTIVSIARKQVVIRDWRLLFLKKRIVIRKIEKEIITLVKWAPFIDGDIRDLGDPRVTLGICHERSHVAIIWQFLLKIQE